MSSVTDTLNNMQNATAIQQAVNQKNNGSANEMDGDMFLQLMIKQLQYQDPMNPMSNQDFLAQQAQFSSLTQLQQLNESITSNNTVTQAVSLIGKEVTLTNPDDPTKTITGICTEAVFDSNGSAIKVNGKDYPLGLVQGIREPGSSPGTDGSDEPGDSDNTENPADNNADNSNTDTENTPLAASANSPQTGEYLNTASKIVNAVGFIAANIAKYLK